MNKIIARLLILAVAVLVMAACSLPPLTIPAGPQTPASEQPASEVAENLPVAVEYDLGETILVQERFPEDSRFRNMPARVNGLIAAPDGDDGPYPVVVILHGTHPGCPVDETGVDRWPCDREVEQPNYRGFEYLARELAAEGYVALSLNINAENTFGFGEPTSGERLQQLIDQHLKALAIAADGGANPFGVELAGRADLSRLALFGHSRGGEMAVALANSPAWQDASQGYGPVAGILQIAAGIVSVDPWNGSAVPLATILAACDGDVTSQDGQTFFEGIRLARQETWAASAWLERANHNSFNSILPGDPFGVRDRPDCEQLLDPEAQRAWLVDYAGDFLAVLFDQDTEAAARLGLDVLTPAPDALYGLPARVAFLPAGTDRQTVFIPGDAGELTTHLLGGEVITEGVATHFCPKGFYNVTMLPGSEPCRRSYVTIPGQPAHAVISWEQPGAALRFVLPEGAGNLSDYTTLSLRAAVDPASPLNHAGSPQALAVQLTDRAGNSATVATRPDEPALRFPPGLMQQDDVVTTGFFTGRVPLTTIRFPLSDFEGVDLADVSEIALLFDQSTSGALFLADLEWVQPTQEGSN